MPVDSSEAKTLDPYVEATHKDVDIKQKIDETKEIIKAAGVAMLVTRDAQGHMHSRAMAPASKDGPFRFEFIANSESGKFEEVQADDHANVSFYDTKTTAWISASGKASISTDKARIKEIWNPIVSAWFGDLKDGVHDGSADDPRVQLLVVEPESLRVWVQQQTSIGQLANIVTSAVTGKTANPGALRTITKAELDSVRSQYQ